MKHRLLTIGLVAAVAGCSAESASRPAARSGRAFASSRPTTLPSVPAERCGDGPVLYETVSIGVGADGGGYSLYSPSHATLRAGGAFRVEVGGWSHEGCLSAGEERDFTRALAAARFTGGSASCATEPHVDILVRDVAGGREVTYQLFSASIDDPCGALPDASVLELGRQFARLTLRDAPAMPAA